ncbi:hypothetical protein HPT27_14805 [Permianibacter sp. IMCC34836]|uniref:hypothetical protein n=1 Tax=Permianibacter fluminis TaxID=2738515 RepID=UPI0015551D28|nr:hypothetical protein [Permianibacter fluminis]NQD38295.1 hypothetical protein [Permianibacter fluminis]
MENIFYISLFIAVFGWMIYAPIKIARWRDLSKMKLSEFESSLQSPLSSYQAYTNNHPYVWGEVDYNQCKDEYLRSISLGPNLSTYCPKVSLRVIESTKSIYLVAGTDQFDWSSLYHYEEWIESNKEVSERIREYKSTGRLRNQE